MLQASDHDLDFPKDVRCRLGKSTYVWRAHTVLSKPTLFRVTEGLVLPAIYKFLQIKYLKR